MNSGAAVKCCAPSIYGNHDFDSDSMYCREQIFFGSPVFSVILLKNLPSVQPAPFAKPRLRAFRNAKKEPSAHQKTLNLGYKDSNLEMTESESVALPFGDSPISVT